MPKTRMSFILPLENINQRTGTMGHYTRNCHQKFQPDSITLQRGKAALLLKRYVELPKTGI